MDITPNAETIPTVHGTTHHEKHRSIFEGIHFHFRSFKHEKAPIIDVNKVVDERMTMGARIADTVAATVGSWPFIIIQSMLLAAWIVLNVVLPLILHSTWDPYPFILLNLALSFQAAYAAPFVMMSQNRQAVKDRLTADNDYRTDVQGEEEIRHIMEHLDHQDTIIIQILQRLETQHQEMLAHVSKLDPKMAQQLGTDLEQIAKTILESEGNGSGSAASETLP